MRYESKSNPAVKGYTKFLPDTNFNHLKRIVSFNNERLNCNLPESHFNTEKIIYLESDFRYCIEDEDGYVLFY